MQVKHLDHLNLSVNGFDETQEWYHKVFGFEVVEKGIQNGAPWGVLKSGEAMLCIYENPARRFLGRYELVEKEIHGINHFAFRILDREKWEETVKRENLQLLYGGINTFPHSISWYVKDPTGYEIEVALWNNDEAKFD